MVKNQRAFSFFSKTSIIILAVLLLAACGTSKPTESSSTESNPTESNPTEVAKQPSEKVELVISTAVSLTDAVEEIKAVFEEENQDILVTYNFGSSGKLAEQISQGAPADIFLSASKKDMDTLEEKELILKDSRFDFASNALVVITTKEKELTLPSLEALVDLNVTNIAMGHTESTPLGRYAKESFENLHIWDKVEGKMVYGSDVRQVLSYVESGNADLGILYITDALTSDKVKVLHQFDASLHKPVLYPAAIISDSKHPEAAQKYLDFLQSEQGKSILQSFGFVTK